jgi:pimeloyl-ACP methyl ester carboxylesterase
VAAAGQQPVLMIHGAGGGAWEWNVWRRVFRAAGHEVTVPELAPAAAGLEATGFDDYLTQVLSAWPAAAPVVVGASLGGRLALAAAGQRECAALVLLNPLPPLPEAAALPPRDDPARVPWGRNASLAGTRRALPDADASTWVYAARRWRDESGRVLREARDRPLRQAPRCPILVCGSVSDDDVPVSVSEALATRLQASFWRLQGSHVGPLLGQGAAALAAAVHGWLRLSVRFTTD